MFEVVRAVSVKMFRPEADCPLPTPATMMCSLEVFVYLQVLDLMTTVLGLRLGLSELSPFIRMLMAIGPVAGVAMAKVVALVLGAVCIYLEKRRVIVWINYWFAALVVWNLGLLIQFAGLG